MSTFRVPRPAATAHEHGVALIMALLTLLVLSLAVAGIMMTLNTDTKVAGHQLRGSQAFYIAEAGVAEAEARIRFGDVPGTLNAKMVTQIFNAPAGSVPVLGTDSTALATLQPSGAFLDYSTATKTDRVLTISYKTDAARNIIYRYDVSKNPSIQTQSGLPIYVIRSTGVKGTDRSTVVTEVVQRPFNVNVKGAMACNVGIDFSGTSWVCGANHSIDTPAGSDTKAMCAPWELDPGLSGAWSCNAITTSGASLQDGNPAISQNQVGFYNGPWECLGLSQQEFFTWVGAPYAAELNPPRGLVYHDNDGLTQNMSGSWHYNGGNGEGLLYCDGDLQINGNFNYVGLIYVEGNLDINGTAWILGGIIVRGVTTVKIANGNFTTLYSADAIQQKIAKYGGTMMKLSWREAS